MGDFSIEGGARARLFASARSWIEGAAIQQFENLAAREHVIAVAGMPDLHPGHKSPVGCAALAAGHVYPDIVGTDIGCGMQFHVLELPERRLKMDRAVERLAALEGPWAGEGEEALAQAGLTSEGGADDDPSPRHFSQALGTVGGGNHFCEVQGVAEIVDPALAASAKLAKGGLALLVHSGSRAYGAAVYARFGADGPLPLAGAGGLYLAHHDRAVRFASLNRRILAQRACAALRTESVEILDNPHNLAERRGVMVLHRKGAAPADRGLVPIPGSRGALTYLVQPLTADPDALRSLAHGAGRKFDRGSMEKRVRTKASDLARLARNPFGGRVICSDRKLLVEEAPEAYKDIARVIGDLEAAGLCKVAAILRPLVTFKTARDKREDRR